jgi:hypothetical protein
VSINPSGLVSGTPTTAGTSSVTAKATDTTGASGSTSFTWTVNPLALPPCGFAITTATPLPSATRGSTYPTTLTRCRGTPPYSSKKIGKLPKSLKLRHCGVISGTPKKAGTSIFNVTMTDNAKPKHTAMKMFSITVN